MSRGQRKLAAIMFTDMIGYTSLGQKNEILSLELVEEQRRVIRSVLPRHGGREVKTMGDAFLVEFSNALDAIRCAYDIQRSIREYNISRTEENRVHLRVGIHLGDVVEVKGDISGDAVNVASRIEPLAEDGGVALTRQVYDQVNNKFELPLSSLGEKSLKNVNMPVELFKIVMPWESERTQSGQLEKTRVAVLPFANISPDPNDEYFADGLTEELISKLSLVKGLKVIARTSVMGYKNKEKKISEIGNELKVGSIVEGSVRKAGKRIRVTAQLIDVTNEEHLWASSYDKDIDDIFVVQADIASKIAESLPVTLSSAREDAVRRGDTKNVEAYSQYLKAKQLKNQGTADSLRQALELLTNATKLDPYFARAFVEIGNCYANLGIKSYVSYEEGVHGMKSAAQRALAIDGSLAEGHALASFVAWVEDNFGEDEQEARKAIELNPNLAEAYLRLALVMGTNGHLNEMVRLLESAHLLDPLSSEVIGALGQGYFFQGRDSQAMEFWQGNRKFAPFIVSGSLFDYYLAKGDFNGAEREIRQLEALAPDDSATILSRAMLAAAKGDPDATRKAVDVLERRFKGGATLNRNIGIVRYCEGDMDAYFEAMFRAVEDHVFAPIEFRYSPLYEKARHDPRYLEVLKKNGLTPEVEK